MLVIEGFERDVVLDLRASDFSLLRVIYDSILGILTIVIFIVIEAAKNEYVSTLESCE